MRIGIIAPPWLPIPPPAYGGIESFVDVLARALVRAGHEVLLAASGDSSCPVHRLPGFPDSDDSMMGVTTFELRHLLRAFAGLADVDVIVDNTLAGPILAKSACAVPLVEVAHGPFVPIVSELYSAAAPGTRFVAISRHQASTAGAIRIARVIHHGIDVDAIPSGPGGASACFLGRMHPSKGLPLAIEAARIAGVHLRIGAKMRERAERAYFDDEIRPLLGAHAEYLGELATEEKYDLLGQSCALLNPIQWDEPFGLVMIESLAAGTPVVATTRGSAPEIIDDGVTGFLADDVLDLATSLQRAGALERSACRAAVPARFSADRMAADYLALFCDVTRVPAPRTHAEPHVVRTPGTLREGLIVGAAPTVIPTPRAAS